MNGGHKIMGLVKSEDNQDLDLEWVALIKSARSMGFTIEDVRKVFLCLSDKDDTQETAV
ncbi:anti-repressor SinI family protein [Paenibacillus sp. Soil522]|uniref:anti-repressor SinI family protein n=1 Tax=Paenibacillus sp. Soil522 TaxID=1736388 RepID=UPI002E121E08